MKEIKLFGASNLAGEYFKNEYKKFLNKTKLVSFSRSSKFDIYFDFNSSLYPKELNLKEDTLIISLAPYMAIRTFFKKLY